MVYSRSTYVSVGPGIYRFFFKAFVFFVLRILPILRNHVYLHTQTEVEQVCDISVSQARASRI